MKNGAIIRAALVVILSAFALSQPAFAQNALGGPKKPTAVGGAAKQNSPVVPANKAGAQCCFAAAEVRYLRREGPQVKEEVWHAFHPSRRAQVRAPQDEV